MNPLTGNVPVGAANSTRQVVVQYETRIPRATVTPLNASATNTPPPSVSRNESAADTRYVTTRTDVEPASLPRTVIVPIAVGVASLRSNS